MTGTNEQRLQAENDELKKQIRIRDIALRAANVMIQVTNASGENIFNNDPQAIMNYAADGELTNFLSLIDLIHPEDRLARIAHFNAVFDQPHFSDTPPFEFRYRSNDSTYRWAKGVVRVIREGDEPPYAIFTIWDNTESKAMEDKLHALAERLHSIREDERTSVSREIHDEFGQALTGLKFELAMFFKKIRPVDEDAVKRARAMMAAIDETVQLVRKISTDLRPPILDDFGLNDAVEWLTTDFQKKTGIATKLRIELPDAVVINKEKTISIFRILQEALTNVARHSGADTVGVDIRQQNGSFSMRIKDNGKGITQTEARSKDALGILGMMERALALGASFTIGADEDRGTLIEFVLPLRA